MWWVTRAGSEVESELNVTLVVGATAISGWIALWQFALASVPLAASSVVLFRGGRKGLWPVLPWGLAALLGPIYHFGLESLVHWRIGLPPMPLLLAGYWWDEGVYASLFVVIVGLAIFGVRPKRADNGPPHARLS